MAYQEHEISINDINGVSTTTTPRKMLNKSHSIIGMGTPKTPKTPKNYPGKENQVGSGAVHSPSVLRPRIN